MSTKEKKKANWLDPATTAENEVLPRHFKWAWTSRGASLALNVILIMQLTYYCTDMLGMAASVVGVLLLVSKLFDGVTDIIVGFIIDRTHTKFGKARPYEIFIIFTWVFTAMLFSAPDLSQTGLCIYVFVLYTLINSVCATFLNGGDAVYLARSVRNEGNRVSVMSFNGGIIMVLSIVVSMLLPQLISGIGSTREGWIVISLVFAIPLALIGILRFVFIKEVAASEETADGALKEKMSVAESLKCIFKNKYVWLIAGMTMAVQMITNIGSGVQTYYFKYIVGDIGLATLVSLSGMVTPIIMIFFPMLSRKLGTVKLIKVGAVIGVAGYLIRTIGQTNLVTLTVGSLLAGIAVLPITMMVSIYLIDCMDYGEWKTGKRVEGFISSVNSFCSKLGSGIASGLVGLIMGIAGYDGTLAVQSATANTTIVFLFNWAPLICVVILLILAMAYNLDKLMPTIKKDLAEKRSR